MANRAQGTCGTLPQWAWNEREKGAEINWKYDGQKFQERQWTPCRMEFKRPTLKHVKTKLPKVKTKQSSMQQEMTCHTQGVPSKTILTVEARRLWAAAHTCRRRDPHSLSCFQQQQVPAATQWPHPTDFHIPSSYLLSFNQNDTQAYAEWTWTRLQPWDAHCADYAEGPR